MQEEEEQGLDTPSGGPGPPIIIKKVSGGGGHHGGAWKVAFADFVTAMMALFMVLWLMSANADQKEAIAAYFHDPKGFAEKWGSNEPGITISKDDLEGLANKIQHAMKEMPELEELMDNVVATVTGDGLRIELLENDKGMFFQSGSPSFERFRPYRAADDRGRADQAAQRDHHRRAHRLASIHGTQELFELGAFRRPCQRGSADLDRGGPWPGPHRRSARLRGHQVANTG